MYLPLLWCVVSAVQEAREAVLSKEKAEEEFRELADAVEMANSGQGDG